MAHVMLEITEPRTLKFMVPIGQFGRLRVGVFGFGGRLPTALSRPSITG